MRDIAHDPAPIEARDAAHLEVEEVLERARAAVARSREILQASRATGFDAAPPAPDADAG